MNFNLSSESRNENIVAKKKEPSQENISELHQIINSIPELGDNDNEVLNKVLFIFFFNINFDFDLYHSLSTDEVSILLDLISCPSIEISYQTINLFTHFLKNDPKLIDEFIDIELVPLIQANMSNTADNSYHISSVAFLYEILKINNELRDEFLSLDLVNFIINDCTPFPDKIFFEFLTLLVLEPTFLPEIAEQVIESFITQEVPQERTITVIKSLISLIQADENLIMPIISSDFLEKIVSSLGRVNYTIAMFLKFASVALQIDQPAILDAFLKIDIFDIIQSSLELTEKKEISFADMMLSALRTDKSPKNGEVSANDKLLKQSSNLMCVLLQFDNCLSQMEFVSKFDYTNAITEGLSFGTIEVIIRFLLNYSIKMPVSIARNVLNEDIIRNAFLIASSKNSEEIDQENEYVSALSEIASKFSNDDEITDLINSINEEFDNVVIE